MLKIAHLLKRYIIAVYVEPFAYRASSAPTGEVIYDLSKATDGISPIPGFINLVDAKAECACFVPVLGFEGGRFAHMIEKVQPLEKGIPIVPIIGVPGFRPEYPFTAYLGNRKPLKDTQSWRHVRLATANCPFSLFRCLEDIHRTRARHVLQVAPIGTKPHVLGAIMYALAHPDTVEVIYDHPTRRPEGTRGTARVLGYHVSPLMSLYSVAAS